MDPITMHAASPPRRFTVRKARRPWADLPPDLLQDVSSSLHNDADNVRLHAVCRPWRRTSPFPLFRVASTPCNGLILHSTVDSPRRLYFSPDVTTLSYSRNYAPFARFTGKRNWVASSDGTAAWFFTASPEPTLLDLVTRDVNSLPRLPDDEIVQSMEYSRGIIYSDGTIFLYSFVNDSGSLGRPSTFTAAILRPGDAVWTVMKKKLHVIGNRCTRATYHDGKVLVFVDVYKYLWCVLTPGYVDDGRDMEGGRLEAWMLGDVEIKYFRNSYVLESHGELLWVTIFVDKSWRHVDPDRDPTQAVSVKVHMLEGSNNGGNMRWVPKNGQSLSDRVLFLGSPASFTADVTHLDVANGGCVYFIFDRCVLRYNLVDSEAKLVERLCPGWGSDKAHVWLRQ